MPTGWFQKKGTPKINTPPVKSPGGPRPDKGARISQLLSLENILIAPEGANKNGLLESLVKNLCEKKVLSDPKGILAKVEEREEGISTTLDTGLSLPHVRLDGLANIIAAMAIVPKGIPDPKQPDLIIRVMFLFFSPNKQEAFPLHLQLLRRVSALFQPAFIDQLCNAATPAAALALIQKLEV